MNLGEQFKFDYEAAKPIKENVIQGEKYRFTILSERLIRMEYNKDGIFEDRPTELVWYRNMPKVEFTLKQDKRYLEITTSYFRLTYTKNKPFEGSKFNNLSNLKVELLNSDKIWYYNHPEVRNFKSPGFSLDNASKMEFEKGLYSVDGFASIDDSKHNLFDEHGGVIKRDVEEIDIYLFMYLKDFALCLKDYFSITGSPALIPRYALGNWWSKNEVYNDKKLKSLIDEFEENKIPLSVLLLDKSWHYNHYDKVDLNTGFTWNNDNIKNPNNMIKYLHSKGIRIGLNVNPMEGFYPIENIFDQLENNLEKNEKGIIPFNVYDKKVVDVYFNLLIHNLDNMGVDFYWMGIENKNEKQELFYLNHYHSYDMMRNFERRPLTLSRNTNIAAHRYPVLYSGKTIVDWNTLKMIPLWNASASNIGVSFWSHDIGGYYKGIEDSELYTRFVQLGVFSPILKFGSDNGKYYKREPWKWGVKTYQITKNYLNLRHSLIPYLYTEAYKYHKYGNPLIMPIYYKFPEMVDDENYKYGYYFGSELFVCPILKKKDYVMNRVIHKFFLPDGMWYDFVTGKKFPGGKEYISFFKDEDYPVFAKAGSIITLGNNKVINDTTPPKDMEIQIFPGRSNTYNLYEDDGVSDLYKKGFYLITQIDYNYMPNNYTVILRAVEGKSGIVPEKRNYKFVFRNTKQASDVIVYYNDTEVGSNSYVKGPDFIVEVEDIPTTGQLTLNCKGKDIEISAERIINEDIESIISDLQIETSMKEKIDKILFGNLPIKKKRIEIRKLGNRGLEHKFVKLFLKLLEYIEIV